MNLQFFDIPYCMVATTLKNKLEKKLWKS